MNFRKSYQCIGSFHPQCITMREATRACRALALFQVMADNPETRKDLIKAKIPHYFYPFLKSCGDDKPLEYARITALGVLGALTKFDDPYGSHAFISSWNQKWFLCA
ncbi:hypothetical protein RDI58_018379 [Solanum bulbocastanum]|uniref:Uncharacterized protein n=1 Tax=Solanum bulbocastanum TaxID=147425 RepID=A0AAN8TE29_SOLBU